MPVVRNAALQATSGYGQADRTARDNAVPVGRIPTMMIDGEGGLS